jgi:hypothetical protein
MDESSVVLLLLCGIVDKLVDGGAHLVLGVLAFVYRDIVNVPIYETAKSAAFAFVGFAFALVAFSFALVAFAFSSAPSGLPDVVCIAPARFDVCR